MLMSGGRGEAAQRTERFADLLGKALHHEVPLEFVDERLSSKTAERALKREGHEIVPKDGLVDQLAATVILQDYLNGQRGPAGYLLPDEAMDMPCAAMSNRHVAAREQTSPAHHRLRRHSGGRAGRARRMAWACRIRWKKR